MPKPSEGPFNLMRISSALAHCVALLTRSSLTLQPTPIGHQSTCRQEPSFITLSTVLLHRTIGVLPFSKVIHLRAGDVSELNNHYYISNPLYYYAQLSQFYSKAIIVTEPGSTHVLMDSVRSLFPDHELVHGSADDDYQLLRHSVDLASSGGTFAIAAVLLSQNIKQFHCTDGFQIEHLNPLMIDAAKVNVRMLRLHRYADQWLRSQNRRDLLLNWRPRPQV